MKLSRSELRRLLRHGEVVFGLGSADYYNEAGEYRKLSMAIERAYYMTYNKTKNFIKNAPNQKEVERGLEELEKKIRIAKEGCETFAKLLINIGRNQDF